MKIRISIISLIVSLLFFSCKPESPPRIAGAYETGVFVTNEGVFSQTSGTISYYQPDNHQVEQQIFRQKNNRDLGNVVQSMLFTENNKAYIVVNNSNKIEVTDGSTFEELAQITNLEQPRYILAKDTNIAYVSQWGADLLSGSIAILDLNNNTVLQTIRQGVGKGPERMLLHNDKLYVTLVGGLETDHKVIVIDINTKTVVDSIITADAPNSIEQSFDGMLWITCGGKAVYTTYPDIDTAASTYGALIQIDPSTNTIITQIQLQKGRGASDLIKNEDGTTLYFSYNSGVYRLNAETKQFQEIFSGNYYGLGYSNRENYIYAATYTGIDPAWVYRRSAVNGEVIDSFKAGVFANNFYFK